MQNKSNFLFWAWIGKESTANPNYKWNTGSEGEVNWPRLHRNHKENKHQPLTHTKPGWNMCCPSTELMWSEGRSGPLKDFNSWPAWGMVDLVVCHPNHNCPGFLVQARGFVIPLHQHVLLYPVTGPDLLELDFKKAKENPAVLFLLFSWQPHGCSYIWPVFQPKPRQAGRLVKNSLLRACKKKKILNRMGQVSLHLVFARDGSVNQSRGTEIPLLSRQLLKQNQAPKRACPSHCCTQACIRNIPK